jgi:hypothetical protein
VADVTPAGTVNVWALPVYVNDAVPTTAVVVVVVAVVPPPVAANFWQLAFVPCDTYTEGVPPSMEMSTFPEELIVNA